VTDQLFGVVLIRSGREVGAPAEPERVGCTARMHRVERRPDGQMFILTFGEQRFRLTQPARTMPEGYLVGDVEMLAEPSTATVAPELLASVVEEFEKYRAANLTRMGQTDRPQRALPTEPAALSYRVGATLHIDPRELQPLLELDDVAERLQQELVLLKRENKFAAQTIGPFSKN
jgi:hypothetical protein